MDKGLILGVSGKGQAVDQARHLPLCPCCNKNSLWVYPKDYSNLKVLVPFYDFEEVCKYFVACSNECGFRTEVFSEVKDCLKSYNLARTS